MEEFVRRTWRLEDQDWWKKYSAFVRECERIEAEYEEKEEKPEISAQEFFASSGAYTTSGSYGSCSYRYVGSGSGSNRYAGSGSGSNRYVGSGSGAYRYAGSGSGAYQHAGSGSGSGSGSCDGAMGYGLGLI